MLVPSQLTKKMKAITISRYGGPEVLTVNEIPKPVPLEDEVLIKVKAASLNAADWHIMRGQPRLYRVVLGIRKPKYSILGADVAGIVEAVGKNVTQFQEGDEVFGDLAEHNFGAFAEYVCVPENIVVLKPQTLTFEEAAAIPLAAATALHALRYHGEVKEGQKVAINGASGGVGAYAIQLAKGKGAEVTAVCSTDKTDQAKMLGADHVIDYTREDFTRNGQKYDAILDTINKSPFSRSVQALTDHGIYLNANPGLLGGIRMLWASNGSNKKIIPWSAGYSAQNLLALKALVEAGKLKPVIDRRYPLEQAAEAHRYVDTGDKIGNVVITI